MKRPLSAFFSPETAKQAGCTDASKFKEPTGTIVSEFRRCFVFKIAVLKQAHPQENSPVLSPFNRY
jgi:hypothetical protein